MGNQELRDENPESEGDKENQEEESYDISYHKKNKR